MDKRAKWQEIANRGLQDRFDPETRAKFDEAVKRGLITLPESEPEGFSVSEMVSNIPSSGAQYLKDMVYPIMHPVQTAKGLQTLGQGLVEKAFAPDEINGWKYPQTQGENVVDAAGDAIMGRYGSGEAVKNTAMTDPVGMTADASALMTTGASLIPRAGKVGKLAAALKDAGKAIDPVNAAMNTAGAGATLTTKALKGVPERMYERAAKFSTTLPKDQRKKMVSTALREGIAPNSRGVDKLNDLVREQASRINDILTDATNQGTKITRGQIFKEMKDIREKLDNVSNPDAARDYKVMYDEMASYHRLLNKKGRDALTPLEVQDLKKNLYEKLNYDERRQVANYAKEETRKGMARGARKSLEEISPEIAERNRRAGDLIELRDNGLIQSASRIDNRDFIGIDPLSKIGAGSILGGPAGTAAGVAATVAGNPKVSPLLAQMLYNRQHMNPLDSMKNRSLIATLLRQGGVMAGRNAQNQEEVK